MQVEQEMRLSPGELANELCMSSEVNLLVEGASDKRFWRGLQHKNKKKYKIYIADTFGVEEHSNKQYVIAVMRILEKRSELKTLGLVDVDYDYVLDKIERINNLFYYKYKDLEITLLKTHALESLINRLLLSEEREKNKKNISSTDLVNIVFEACYSLGILRLINEQLNNEKEKENFNFEKVNITKTVGKDLVIRTKEQLNYYFSVFSWSKKKRETVETKFLVEIEKNYPREYICSGHDAIKVLVYLIINRIGNKHSKDYTENTLSDLLQASYMIDKNDLENYLDIKQLDELVWQAK